MTDYEFGYCMFGLCNIRQVREMVMRSAMITGRLCDTEQGFVEAIKQKSCKSAADRAFLAKLEKELAQKRITEAQKG